MTNLTHHLSSMFMDLESLLLIIEWQQQIPLQLLSKESVHRKHLRAGMGGFLTVPWSEHGKAHTQTTRREKRKSRATLGSIARAS